VSLKGTLAEFPLDALLRLLADTKKTGELNLRGAAGEGALGIDEGKVVTSVYGDEQPISALGAIFAMTQAEFEFTPWPDAPPANLEGELQDNLRKAGEYREWLASVRQVIPDDRTRFRLSERAAEQGAVTFTSDRWRVVLAVNGQRDVSDLATHLKIDRDAALTTLAGLVRDGVLETIVGPAAPAPPPVVDVAPPAPEPPAAEAAPAPATPSEDWSAALLKREAEAAAPAPPPPPMPAAADWGSPPPPEPAAPEVAPAAPAADPAPAADQWTATPPPAPAAQDWGAPPAAEPPAAPAQDWGTPAPAASEWSAPAPAEPAPPPPPVDDRLAALFGDPATPAATDQWTTSASAAADWSTPTAEPAPPLADDPRLASLAMPPAPAAEPAAPPPPAPNEWAPPPALDASPPPKKKGLFGFGGGKEKVEPPERPIRIAIGTAGRASLLGAFSNALLNEYNNGAYGKGKVDDRMPSLLMRVDEQADPIDKPLPVVDDRLDAQALERIALPEQQVVPYLAILISTIYADAEKAFGRDKAKKGYKVAQQSVFGADASTLGGADLAGKLPKV